MEYNLMVVFIIAQSTW